MIGDDVKRILITGARAPAALDLMRKLSRAGFLVFVADSVRFPLSRASSHVEKFFLLPAPTKNLLGFVESLEEIILLHKIDLLIPTCEEVFFISRYKERLEERCLVFCDNFNKLRQFHDKFSFIDMARDCGAMTPNTELIDQKSVLSELTQRDQKVFKPVFSRFASHTLICPSETALGSINPGKEFPWVAQDYVQGTEYCTYSIAVNGRLQAHSCYQPTYRVGIGSGIYFTPVLKDDIQIFVENFVRKHHFTGQIGFDFIVTEQEQLYVIECNPRATSGLHCLPDDGGWAQIIAGSKETPLIADQDAKMVALAMLTFGLKYLRKKNLRNWIEDFQKARDPVWSRFDIAPSFYQLISLVEIIIKAARFGITLREAATSDIEWNGEPI